ncbi:MAG: sugar ABC transporter permease [Gammaproteobacteria bacterium]|nr:sugar ABC transporter permease [Gammaproteobacteria bacterium]HAN80499.1 sugar ABC transporter permease [Gammaproteobacteria bacterium]
MNLYAIKAIYVFEMARTFRTPLQSFASPVISTILYFVVFGSAIGNRMLPVGDVSYGAFIVPGLIMLTVMTQSVANASFGIYFPTFLGTIYEHLSAPISPFEMVAGYVGASATKSVVVGFIILAVSFLFVSLKIEHLIVAVLFLIMTAFCFSLLGFILGLWAKNFEQLSFVPTLIITPLVFLGGSFYSIDMLPSTWQVVSMFNPAMYLISGFRWAFFGVSEVPIQFSFLAVILFAGLFVSVIGYMFKTGYRLRN